MADMNTGIGLIIVLFLVVLAILWILLPFAVFGTKDLLEELIKETKKTNELLQKIDPLNNNITISHKTKPIHQYDDVVTGG